MGMQCRGHVGDAGNAVFHEIAFTTLGLFVFGFLLFHAARIE